MLEGKGSHIVASYYIAVPTELLSVAEEFAPSYAGIIEIRNWLWKRKKTWFWDAQYIRKAKRIPNARKLTDRELMTLTRNACQRFWAVRLLGKTGRE